MEPIIPAFEISLLDPSLSDVIMDMAELGIDSCLEDGAFKSIPIVGTLIGVAKTGQHLYDRNLLRQTLEFIKAVNAGTISHEKLDQYRMKIHSDRKKAEEELGRALIILNSTVDTQKSRILGRLYRNYVDQKINWQLFCELSDVVSWLFVADLELLLNVYKKEIKSTEQCDSYKAERLSAVGLISLIQNKVEFSSSTGPNGAVETSKATKVITLTGFGENLIRFGIL